MALRSLIDSRFPSPRQGVRRVLPTGVAGIDALLHGGLSTGTLTEFVSTAPSGGSQLALGAILLATRERCQRVALVDAANAFDISGFEDDAIAHMVCVRCQSLSECWRSADVLVRDPNFALVAMDVRGFTTRELLRVRDSTWIRLQRAAEHADTALVVQTDTAVVPNAGARLVFQEPLADDALVTPRATLVSSLGVRLEHLRLARAAG